MYNDEKIDTDEHEYEGTEYVRSYTLLLREQVQYFVHVFCRLARYTSSINNSDIGYCTSHCIWGVRVRSTSLVRVGDEKIERRSTAPGPPTYCTHTVRRWIFPHHYSTLLARIWPCLYTSTLQKPGSVPPYLRAGRCEIDDINSSPKNQKVARLNA